MLGNLTSGGQQTFTYDATGQQTSASLTDLAQSYDGDCVRIKRVESGAATYYGPEAAQAVILKALAFEPQGRYQIAAEFGEDFAKAVNKDVNTAPKRGLHPGVAWRFVAQRCLDPAFHIPHWGETDIRVSSTSLRVVAVSRAL